MKTAPVAVLISLLCSGIAVSEEVVDKQPSAEAGVMIEVHRLGSTPLTGIVKDPPELSEERFFKTQREILRSPAVMHRVIERLNLLKRYPGSTIDTLKADLRRRVQVSHVDGSAILTVTCVSSTKKEAQELVGAVVSEYGKFRLSDHQGRDNNRRHELDAMVREQHDLVKEKAKLFFTIVKAMGVPYVEGEPPRQLPAAIEDDQIGKLVKEEYELSREERELASRIKALRKLVGGEKKEFAGSIAGPTSLLPRLLIQERAAKRDLQGLEKEGLAPKHPKVLMQKVQIDRMEEDIAQAMESMGTELKARLATLERQRADLKKNIERARVQAVDWVLMSKDYTDAQEDYERSRDLLDALTRAHTHSRVGRRLQGEPYTKLGSF